MKTSSQTQPVPLGAERPTLTSRHLRPLAGSPRSRGKGGQVSSDKWASHRAALLAMREAILSRQAELRESSSEPIEKYSMDMADSASDEFDHEMALSVGSSQQDVLYEIDEALTRIQNGAYGICEATGKAISEARLAAIPWTRYTVEAEAEFERSGGVTRPHLGTLGSVHSKVTGNLEDPASAEITDEEPEQEPTAPKPPGSRPHDQK